MTAMLVLVGDGRALLGMLRGEDGVERQFSGWMELAGAIETWRAGGADVPGSEGPTSPGSLQPGGLPEGGR